MVFMNFLFDEDYLLCYIITKKNAIRRKDLLENRMPFFSTRYGAVIRTQTTL